MVICILLMPINCDRRKWRKIASHHQVFILLNIEYFNICFPLKFYLDGWFPPVFHWLYAGLIDCLLLQHPSLMDLVDGWGKLLVPLALSICRFVILPLPLMWKMRSIWKRLRFLMLYAICKIVVELRMARQIYLSDLKCNKLIVLHVIVGWLWELLQVQVPSSGSETIECGVCQHPFLVSAHWFSQLVKANERLIYSNSGWTYFTCSACDY